MSKEWVGTYILFRKWVSLSWHESFSAIGGKYLLLTGHIWAPWWGILLESLCFPILSVSSRLAVFNGKNLITWVRFVGKVENVDSVGFYIMNICSVLLSNVLLLENAWLFWSWPCSFYHGWIWGVKNMKSHNRHSKNYSTMLMRHIIYS